MMCCVLKHWDPMLSGDDLHDTLPPPTGMPITPSVPHFAFATLGQVYLTWGWTPATLDHKDVLSLDGRVIERGSDIGPGIPHIAANYLLPIIILTSASKSYFGVASVQMNNLYGGGPTPVAVAVLAILNLNVNCCGPACPPLPIGRVFALNTHVAGMTLADFVVGLCVMAAEILVQYLLNKLFASSTVSNWFDKAGKWLMGPIIRGFALKSSSLFTSLLARGANPYVAATAANLLPAIVGTFVLGSPLGYSPQYTPIGGGLRGNLPTAGSLGQAVGEHLVKVGEAVGQFIHSGLPQLLNAPSVPQFPSAAPLTA